MTTHHNPPNNVTLRHSERPESVDHPLPVSKPVHPLGWYSVDELDGLPMFPNTIWSQSSHGR